MYPIRWWQSKYFHEPKGESFSPHIIFLALGPGLLDPWAESLSRRTPDNMPLLPLPRWSLKPPADATFLLFHLAGAFLGASSHWQRACGAVFKNSNLKSTSRKVYLKTLPKKSPGQREAVIFSIASLELAYRALCAWGPQVKGPLPVWRATLQ